MANPFLHAELATADVAKAKEFYGKLFAWKLSDVPMTDGPYTMIDVGEGTAGGIWHSPHADMPSFWMPYVLVDDVAAATEKARSLGAKVMRDVTDAGMGKLSIITDPAGAMLGLWQPAPG